MKIYLWVAQLCTTKTVSEHLYNWEIEVLMLQYEKREIVYNQSHSSYYVRCWERITSFDRLLGLMHCICCRIVVHHMRYTYIGYRLCMWFIDLSSLHRLNTVQAIIYINKLVQKNFVFPQIAYSVKCSCECIISFLSNSILDNQDILDWFEACRDFIQLGWHIRLWYDTRLHLVGVRYTDSRWGSVCVLLPSRPTTTWETMWLPRNVVLLWKREQCLISECGIQCIPVCFFL